VDAARKALEDARANPGKRHLITTAIEHPADGRLADRAAAAGMAGGEGGFVAGCSCKHWETSSILIWLTR